MGIPGVISGRWVARARWNELHARSGDALVTAAIREAERILAQKRSRGASVFRVEPGKPAERIQRLYPHAEQLIRAPGMDGG